MFVSFVLLRGKAGDKKTWCLISETPIKLCRYIYYSRLVKAD